MLRVALLLAALQSDSTPPASRRGPMWLPLGSLVLPGLGQYVQGAPKLGAAFTGVAAAGLAVYASGDDAGIESGELPRDGARRRAFGGLQTYQTAGALSAYDSFRRVAVAQQGRGRYRFLTQHEPVGRLLTAPVDPEFLGRWTTWAGLAYTGLVAWLADNDDDRVRRRLTGGDVVFGSLVALNAGIGEEAMFRGWLYPVMYQAFGERFWLANGTQAALFGALHPDAEEFAFVIAGWAFYQGWLTRRNGWSVRESVFQHVWYDVVVILLDLAREQRVTLSVALPLR